MVGKICTVCRRYSYAHKQLSFFTYPGDSSRRYDWLVAVDRLDLLEKLNNDKTRGNHRICEVHFEKKYIVRSKFIETRKFLTKDAFPTLCLTRNNTNRSKQHNTMAMKNEGITYSSNINGHESIEVNHVSNTSRYNLRPAKKINMTYANSEDTEDTGSEENIYDKVQNELYVEFENSTSSCYVDPLELCESVMTISQSTQTPSKSLQTVKYRKKSEYQDIKIENREGTMCEDNKPLQISSQILSPTLSKLIKWRLSNTHSKQHISLNLFALNLYYSTNLYNLLQEMLSLPSREIVKEFLLPKTTKKSDNFLMAFKCKINNMTSKERICCFSVSSIMLKPNLYYNIKHDRIVGLQDINGVQNIFLAKYAIVLMVHGLIENWQQPIAYAFISEYDHSPQISLWIDDNLETLIDLGLDIRVFASDPRSEFLYTSESRSVTPEKSFFTIKGTNIFYTYNTSHLLRIVKNNLKSCDFYCSPNFEMCNNIEFLIKLSNLCNILNSRSRFSNTLYKRAYSNKKYQKNFLNHMLHLFRNLRVVRKIDDVDVTGNMKFIEGFQITINSVLQVYEELNFLGVRYLLTGRLNRSLIHRSLAHEKQSNNCKTECTPNQFNRHFVKSFVYNMLKKPMGNNNIENILESEEFSQQLLNEQVSEADSTEGQPLLVYTTDYRLFLFDNNAFAEVCEFCYKKCIEIHQCHSFKLHLNDYDSPQNNHCEAPILENGIYNSKKLPPNDFTEFLMLLENKFTEYFKPDVTIHNIGQEVLKELEQCEFGMPCPCFPIDYLKRLFIRVRLFYTISKNNRMFKKRKVMRRLSLFNL